MEEAGLDEHKHSVKSFVLKEVLSVASKLQPIDQSETAEKVKEDFDTVLNHLCQTLTSSPQEKINIIDEIHITCRLNSQRF